MKKATIARAFVFRRDVEKSTRNAIVYGMNVSWLGYRAVRLEGKEGSVLIDPHSKEVGVRAPRLRDDLILSEWGALPGAPENDSFIVTGPGEYERKGIAVRGVLTYRDDAQGNEQGLNTAYVVRVEDMTVCHLGALGQKELTGDQLDAIGDVDVLVLPVGGHGVLDASAATRIVSQVEPKVVIPVQYAVSGKPYDADTVEKFTKEVGLDAENIEKLKLARKSLPVDETHLYVLKP